MSNDLDKYLTKHKLSEPDFASLMGLSSEHGRNNVNRWRRGLVKPMTAARVLIEMVTKGEVTLLSWDKKRGRK